MKEKELEFNRIVKANKAAIFTVCYLFSKDQDEVNDLFQETLINLWRGFDGFQGKCDVKTWIWRGASTNSGCSIGQSFCFGWRT